MQISAKDFKHEGFIPEKFTCQGEDVNPCLQFSDIPKEAVSLALIVDDPDAPAKTWVHWVVYDIAIVDQIEENSTPGTLGENDFKKQSWGGPCPPAGVHRYFFKLYALDANLNLSSRLTKNQLEKEMEG